MLAAVSVRVLTFQLGAPLAAGVYRDPVGVASEGTKSRSLSPFGMTPGEGRGVSNDRAGVYIKPRSPFDFAQGKLSTARPMLTFVSGEKIGRSGRDDVLWGPQDRKRTMPASRADRDRFRHGATLSERVRSGRARTVGLRRPTLRGLRKKSGRAGRASIQSSFRQEPESRIAGAKEKPQGLKPLSSRERRGVGRRLCRS
jgi:hypothetical protein